MQKELSQMTLEELWQLFPIVLVQHQSKWKDWYQEEVEILKSLLPQESISAIYHIGSTAIDTIMAKPIVDILIEVNDNYPLTTIKDMLLTKGYLCMNESEIRVALNKGYTKDGYDEKVFHIHLRKKGDIDEVYFRDYLLMHKDIAQAYEALKLSLGQQYPHHRDHYTEGKTDFVKHITNFAKKQILHNNCD
ncbi:MAG: GrpB family protein [Prevotella sp.]|nr:GrpB family protein [Staphylococcus sp.]MCM1350183.1 GrpB family protein [Prevotella sp.]